MDKDSASKHPLKKRVFYLDVKSHQNRTKLRSYLAKLGGVVSEFLDSKEVKYLITDKQQKDWPCKDKPTPNGQEVTPQGTPTKKVSDLLPRGKQFALAASVQPTPKAKTSTTNEANIDVIDLANRRGIKILLAQNVLEFCLKYITEKDKLNCRQSGSSKTVKYFQGNFIKVEDMEDKYRPSAREFTEWPQIYINNDQYACPFIPPSKVKRTSSIGDINAARNAATNETGGQPNFSSKIPATPEIRGDTPKPSTNRTIDLKLNNGLAPARKQETLQYCEICGITFTNMNEHVASNAHQSHLKHEDNFKDLFNVMKSLPKWTDDEETQNLPTDTSFCDSSSYHQNPVYPSLTPPTSSKTITLTPGSTTVKAIGNKTSAKGTFLPLHDYICINNNKLNQNNTNSLKVNYQNDGSVTSALRMRKVNILGNSNTTANANNIAANMNIHNSRNNHSFKIANLIYNNSPATSTSTTIATASTTATVKDENSERRKIIGTKLVDKFNFDQLFSDDEEDSNHSMVEASCFTPPLLPLLLYPELDIPEDREQSIKEHFDVENGNYTDADYDFDEELFASFEKDISVEF